MSSLYKYLLIIFLYKEKTLYMTYYIIYSDCCIHSQYYKKTAAKAKIHFWQQFSAKSIQISS